MRVDEYNTNSDGWGKLADKQRFPLFVTVTAPLLVLLKADKSACSPIEIDTKPAWITTQTDLKESWSPSRELSYHIRFL